MLAMTDLLLPLLTLAVIALAAVLFFVLRRIVSATPTALPEPVPSPEQQQLVAQVAALRGLVEGIQTQSAADRQTIERALGEGAKDSQGLLREVGERLAKIDSAQAQINALQFQVGDLVSILGDKKRRGRFGEIALEDLIRDALPGDLFEFQARLSNGKQVDCLIRLGGESGQVAVDSKFPLEDYRSFLEAADDTVRATSKRAFTGALKGHIDAIAEKYIVPGETREVALMFIPAESIYSDLFENFPEVLEHARKRRIYATSPNTLHGMLTSIRAFYVQTRVAHEARVIQGEVGKILEDIGRLDDRVESLTRHFDQAQKDIENIQKSSKKIAKRGEDISTMELSSGEELAAALPEAFDEDGEGPDDEGRTLFDE
jgi:DNA recombination protein RmuC